MKGRVSSLAVLAALLFVATSLYLFEVQVRGGSGETATAAAEEARGLRGRGAIYISDREGARIPLATTREYPSVFAVPRDVRDSLETAPLIAETLELPPETVSRALGKTDDPYEPLSSHITDEMAERIRALALDGIYVGSEPGRFYPFGPLASQVIGFVGPKDEGAGSEGRYGIEKLLNENLARGEDVLLTLDRAIQAYAEDMLKNLSDRFHAGGGTVIVMDPKDGRLLALANVPNFDPNRYAEFEIANFRNLGISGFYESGSVVKVLTMAAGIDSGAFTPTTTVYDSGSLTLNGKTIKNWDEKTYGKVTMTEVIERSINVGAVLAERLVGHGRFLDYLSRFGFEETTGVELPGEVAGRLDPLRKEGRDINFANASFGQGVAITPLGLIRAIAALANGGMLVKPYIIEGGAKPTERIIAPETARAVTAMMASAVEKAGVARIYNYTIAGKTGTAQIPDLVRGGYRDAFIHSYVGFAPATNPRFIALIKLDEPQAALAGATVVPAFRDLAEFILNYYRVPPDAPSANNQ